MNVQPDLKHFDRILNRYLRLDEFPVAVKLLSEFEPQQLRREHPHAKIPHLDMGKTLYTCQAMAMARRYGWELILSQKDICCPTGLVVLGMAEMIPSMLAGEESVTPFTQTTRARSRRMRQVPRLESGRCQALLAAPVHRAEFEPDIVVIYANTAQVMRLVQAAVFKRGGTISSDSSGGQGCAQYLSRVLIDHHCRYVLPGNGDRIFGMVGDGQLVFAMPWAKAEEIIEGLEASHKGGQRYPIPVFLKFQPEPPAQYDKLLDKLLPHND